MFDGILKSLRLLEDMCDLTNTIKPPLCNMQYIWTDYTHIRTDYGEKIHLMSFRLITKLIPNGIDI